MICPICWLIDLIYWIGWFFFQVRPILWTFAATFNEVKFVVTFWSDADILHNALFFSRICLGIWNEKDSDAVVADPVSDAFFEGVWNATALKNELIYEEVWIFIFSLQKSFPAWLDYFSWLFLGRFSEVCRPISSAASSNSPIGVKNSICSRRKPRLRENAFMWVSKQNETFKTTTNFYFNFLKISKKFS